MGYDALSPVAFAHINTLLVPAGKIKRARFSSFVKSLQDENAVRLGDVSPDGQSKRSMSFCTLAINTFSPLAFPEGRVVYNISISESPAPSVECFPFELNRETQVVVYLIDGSDLVQQSQPGSNTEKTIERSSSDLHGESPSAGALSSLEDQIQANRIQYRRAILHQVIVCDYDAGSRGPAIPAGMLLVPSPNKYCSTTIKTLMCDITARLLRSIDTLAHEMRNLSAIESPSAPASKSAVTDAAGAHAGASTPVPSTQSFFDLTSARNLVLGSSLSRSTTPTGGRSASRHSVASSSRHDRFSEAFSGRQSRDPSRDRNPTLSSAITSPTDRSVSRTVARSHIISGALYLQAGLWPDAVKNLSEGTAAARNNSDDVWHARGLEYIITCLLMFGWSKMYFQIPTVCYPTSEKGSGLKASSAISSPNSAEVAAYGRNSSDSRTVSLHYFTKLLPDLLNMVNWLYEQASDPEYERFPQLLRSESILRSGHLLSAVFVRKGTIDDQMLHALLSSTAVPKVDSSSRSADTVSLRRSDITSSLLQGIPVVPEDVSLNEFIRILIHLASIISMIGMDRKQGFVLKELLQRLIPALVEARKIGAAEMGIHPASGLLALSSASHSSYLRIEEGMKSLLTLVAAMYGALEYSVEAGASLEQREAKVASWALSRRGRRQNLGNFELKVDVLQSCITICEVLPDFEGVLEHVVQLLHLIRRSITLQMEEPSDRPAISLEEQVTLLEKIKRSVGAAAQIGKTDVLANYWDELLVRAVEPIDVSATRRVTSHSKNDLQAVSESREAVKEGPFIYNPFSKPTSTTADRTLVAGELVHFDVYLQNPFEMVVEIEEIYLLTEGCEFEATRHSVVLGHFCCHSFTMTGTPKSCGSLKIVGCRAKIRYCKERNFGIYPKAWVRKSDDRVGKKDPVLPTAESSRRSSGAEEDLPKMAERKTYGLESEAVVLNVLSAQPLVSLQSLSLAQSALMLLEGEKACFEIRLKNESLTTEVDLILFTFQDSATSQLRTALTNKELSSTEVYELQLQLAGTTPFKRVAVGDDNGPAIKAGKTSSFRFEAVGIPGLVKGTIQVDYAHLGIDPSEVGDQFYTRQLSVPLTVTVNGGVEIPRCNLLPFSGDYAWMNQQRRSLSTDLEAQSKSAPFSQTWNAEEQITSLLSRVGLESHGAYHCLLLLDLRNVWPSPLSVTLRVLENGGGGIANSGQGVYTVHESLQPGHFTRAFLLVPRVYVADPHAPVPTIGPQRQFVVRQSKLSLEAERANREAFWYREELLKLIQGTWREDSTGREGTMDLRRGIRLNARMIYALKLEEVEISLSVHASQSPSVAVSQRSRSRFTLMNNSFATLTTKIHNRRSDELSCLVRIQPCLRNQPHNIALDLSKRFAWTGMLQQVLHPALSPNETREINLGVMALATGAYDISATVEELKQTPAAAGQRRDADTAASGRQNGRKIWHTREPCMIDAVDEIGAQPTVPDAIKDGESKER